MTLKNEILKEILFKLAEQWGKTSTWFKST